jgi:hypothetical protein
MSNRLLMVVDERKHLVDTLPCASFSAATGNSSSSSGGSVRSTTANGSSSSRAMPPQAGAAVAPQCSQAAHPAAHAVSIATINNSALLSLWLLWSHVSVDTIQL